MKYLILAVFSIGLFSCKNPLKKTIFEPLTVTELKSAIKNDSLFEETYKYIQLVKDSVLKSDLDKAKWADLTYNRVYKYVKFSIDTNYFKPIEEKLKNEWKEKYGKYQAKVDSISNYWKQYKNQNSLEQYVKVELAEIYKEYYTFIGDVRSVNLGFRLTPLQGQVDQIRFGYRIEAKINEKEKESDYESLYSTLDNSWCLSTTPFSKPIIRYWEANYTNEKILKSKTFETFNRDYNIYIEVDQIRKDGKNMSNDDLNIPKSVQNHWKYENREYLKDLYVSDIIKEVLNEEYKPEYEYRYEGVDKILKKKDSLSFQFLRLTKNL
jgi:hypothetical protein